VTLSTITIPYAGTWLLNGSTQAGATTAICFSPTVNTFSIPGSVTAQSGYYASISWIYSGAATTYYFVSNTTTNGASMTSVYTYLTRIG
jgi:hypothetical protein